MKLNKITKLILICLSIITFISIIGIVNITRRNREESIISEQKRLESTQESLKEQVDNLQEQLNNKENKKTEVNLDDESFNKNIIEEYNNEQLRKLNIFLSNFSEVEFEDFSISNYDSKRLINFAMTHQIINNYEKSMKFDSNIGRAYIDALNIQNSIDKYFGITVENQSTDIFEYYDGRYLIPQADGEQYTNFTQVKEIYNDGINLKIIGKVYSNEAYIDEASYDNSWTYDPMDRVPSFDKENVEYLGKIEAVIKVINNNGNQIYKLLDYKVDMEN